jgi:ABC-2 type transport system permease protein
MRTLLYLIQKEFRQIRRNRSILPLIFAVPVIQMMVLVYAANFEMKKAELIIIDHDLSEMSRNLTATFRGNDFFRVTEQTFNIAEAEAELNKGHAGAILVIPVDFERMAVRREAPELQLLIDAVDGNKAQLIAGYCQAVTAGFSQKIIIQTTGPSGAGRPAGIDIIENFWYNPRLDYKWFMAPGILAILVTAIGIFMTGLNLVREKEAGTIEQINVTPVRKSQFILAKLIPFWFIALFDLSFGLLIARLLFNLPIEGSLWVLFGMTSIYLIGILGLGLFISTLADTQQQMLFLTFFFILIFILMGGIFTPVESMPGWAQWINRLNPVYYFMRVLRMVILKGSGFQDMVTEMISMLVLGICFVTLAIRRYRKTI